MKAIELMGKPMDMEFILILMGLFMMVNGLRISKKGRARKSGRMGLIIKETTTKV